MLVNTVYFQEEANRYRKTGLYCPYPKGSYQYREYWIEQNKRCIEGHTVGDLYIPGTYYFYLNFSPILRKDEKTGRKIQDFPRFTDVDLEFFLNIEQCRKEKKGFIAVKPRRVGFSFKVSRLCVHEYTFYRDSKCIIGAFVSDLSEHTMNMALEGLNFLDTHTEWKKERNPDTREFVKARYKENTDGIEVWKGYNSEIMRLTFQNNPFASIGKSGSIFIFEEAGRFDNLITSYNISEPCWKDGEDMIGIPIILGTGGDMAGGTKDFSKMFYEPEKYNLLSFENIWDEGKGNTRCGWFIPAYRMRFGEHKTASGVIVPMVDEHGNSNMEAATESILQFRKIKQESHDLRAFRDAVTQYPLTPSEAFLRNGNNMFPVADLQEHLAEVESRPDKYLDTNYHCKLKITPIGEVEYDLSTMDTPILDYPHTQDNLKGCITLFEQPYKNAQGVIPFGMYLAGIDPYDHDQGESLGSIFIMNKLTERIVAEYTGRPGTAQEFYEICRRLLVYYNARANYENNLKGIFDYFFAKDSLYLLAEEPKSVRDVLKDKTLTNSSRKGTRATAAINSYNRELLKQWLITPLGEGEKMNLHTIKSPALLKELIYWDPVGNFDRISSIGMLLLLKQDEIKLSIETENKVKTLADDPWWFRSLKQKNTTFALPSSFGQAKNREERSQRALDELAEITKKRH